MSSRGSDYILITFVYTSTRAIIGLITTLIGAIDFDTASTKQK